MTRKRAGGLSLDPARQHNSQTYHEGYADGSADRKALELGEDALGPMLDGWMYKAGYDHGIAGEPES